MTLKCYCCGKRITKRIALVTANRETDRVFVMLPEHVDRVEAEYSHMEVKPC